MEQKSTRRSRRAEQQAAALHAELLARPPADRDLSASRLTAYLLATLVYACTAALVPLAGWLAFSIRFRVLGIGLGAILLLILWEIRPRRPRPPSEGVVDLGVAPTLTNLLAEVAAAVGTSPPRTVVVTPEINAGVYDGRRRDGRVLMLGAPLWLALPPQSRVALLGHELGHFASGDVRRTSWVTGAFHILGGWRRLLRLPPTSTPFTEASQNITAVIAAYLTAFVLWLVGLLPMALGSLLATVTFSDSRRAEYAADATSVRVAGRTGVSTLLRLLARWEALDATVQRAVLAGSQRPLDAVVGFRLEGPAPSRPLHTHDPWESHPTTDRRLELAMSLPEHSAAVVLDAATSAQIDRELGPALDIVQRRVRDQYLS